jgi:outer membrane protein assembly factor BamB
VAIIVAAVGLVMLLGVAFFSVALFRRAATSGTTGPVAPRPATGSGPAAPTGGLTGERQHRWLSRFQPAFTRGTGQWVNVIGIVDWGNAELTMLDGATGKVLWRVPAPIDSNVYADGADRILAYDAAKRVIRYDAKTGKVRWSITVADFVHDITFGNGCASLRFGKPLGIDTETGSLKDCTPTRPALLRIDREALHDVSLKRGDVEVFGAIRLDNKPINADPPRFLVKASRGGRELWRAVPPNLEPIWTSDGFNRTIALMPSGVFVFGRNPGDHHARWLLLDATTGNTVLSSGNDVKVDDDLWLTSGGSQVFVVHNQSLEVFDSTGKLAWRVADN